MAVLIKSDRTWATEKNLDEWLIRNEADLTNIPDSTGPGSIAYTADLNYMAIMNEDGEWQEIGATTDPDPDDTTPSDDDPPDDTTPTDDDPPDDTTPSDDNQGGSDNEDPPASNDDNSDEET